MALLKKTVLAVIVLAGVACGGGGGGGTQTGDGTNVLPEPDLANIRAFVGGSPYGGVLADCVAVEEQADSCTLETLPLIGLEHDNPDIQAIMTRVAVSHDWMGERFEEVLGVLPVDILTLLKGVTAIVIDDNIRPSFYTTMTGAIYLDPANLWLSNAEKATIDQEQDFRDGFGADLAFRSLWRYVLNGAYAYGFYPLDGTEERELADIVYRLSALLFHELAHANDFFPPDIIGGLAMDQSVVAAAQSIASQRVAQQLLAHKALESDIMSGLAGVMFRGDTATVPERNYTAAQVGGIFEADFASDDYAYSSIYEDVAMLFEEAMMKYHFNIDRDSAYTSAPHNSNSCPEHLVGWGNRNRLGDADVRTRAAFVVGELLPGADLSDFFTNLALPTEMVPGVSWCDNLIAPAARPGEGAKLKVDIDRSVRPDSMLRHH